MPISHYLKNIRQKVGTTLLLLPAVAAVVRSEQGHILFVRSFEDGHWSLPAGAIDPDETPAAAIIREVEEETGLTVEVESVLGVFGGKEFTWTYTNGDTVQYTTIVFRCRIVSGSLEAKDGEATELRFFSAEDMPALQLGFPKELFALTVKQAIFL